MDATFLLFHTDAAKICPLMANLPEVAPFSNYGFHTVSLAPNTYE